MTQTAPRPTVRCISAQEAAGLMQRHADTTTPGLALFDVRDPASYERDHIEGAEHLDEASAGPLLMHLPKHTPILIYCYKGNASQIYGRMFTDFRFTHVYSVDGGRDALAAALAPRPKASAPSPALAAFLSEYGFSTTDLNLPRQHGLTPLMRAALLGRDDLLEELIALGVTIGLRNHDGNTALWLACVSNEAAVVRRLIGAGINLNNQNDAGATCLMYTASSGRHAMMEILLAAGADPLIRNQDDARAVDLCATVECLQLLRHTAD